MKTWKLEFGRDGVWNWSPRADQVVIAHQGPDEAVEVTSAVRAGLSQPLDFPPLNRAIVDGDRVVLALDHGLPQASAAIAGVWPVLSECGVRAEDVLILQPGSWKPLSSTTDPRSLLPDAVRSAIRWQRHDPTQEGSCGYLATSAAGERVYLARELLDADFVLPITLAGFDALQGTRSPMSVFYPGLSTTEAFAKTHGQGHRELQPEDDRPVRQLIEEIGWLLGVQFAVQLVPGGQRGTTMEVLAGGTESVQRQAARLLNQHWRATWPQRPAAVIVTIPAADSSNTWEEVAQAVETARNVVAKGGKIIVLSDLNAAPGPGVDLLRGQPSPRAALQPLREQAPPDLQAASQWANAADWARIYFLSQLDAELVEDLFAVALRELAEVERLLASIDECAVITAAQFTYAEIVEP